MKTRIPVTMATVLLVFTVGAIAQEIPRYELAAGYSYVNFNPNISQITSQNLNGGGGAAVFNLTRFIGIKADFMGYGGSTGWTNKLINQGFPVTGSASGNLFTYMFGPQVKKHSGKFQPFGEGLFGAAHSNGYASILHCISGNDPTSCNLANGHGNNNAFAMQWGGGLDIALSNHVQIRPVEVAYLYTNFSSKHIAHIANSQNNFKYFAGVNFTLGNK